MVPLSEAEIVATHFAPDLDACAALAISATKYPRLWTLPKLFLPAGDLSKEEVRSYEDQRVVFCDVGGQHTGRDHHGSGERISATRIAAREVGLNQKQFAQLLRFVDGNDQQGKNFRFFLRLNDGTKTLPANDLVINCLIRGASHVRFNPMSPKVSLAEQEKSYNRLCLLCRLIVRRIGAAERTSFSHFAREMLQHSFVQAMATHLELSPPVWFTDLESSIGHLEGLVVRMFDDHDYRCKDDLAFAPYIKMMTSTMELAILDGDEEIHDPDKYWQAESLTLLGIAQQLAMERQFTQPVKLAILKECWLNLFAYQGDWLKALGELGNGGIKYQSEIKGWQIAALESECSRIGQASRHICAENPLRRDVIIVKRSNGQVQITCKPQLHLVPKVKQAIVNLRKKEAAIRCLDIPADELPAEEKLVAGWYIPHFGGGLNGSLTNPTVEPTRLDLKTIYQTVCNALW